MLNIEKIRIPIASKDISRPSKGKKVKKAVLIPKAANNPTPHAAQPGAKIPKKIPIVVRTPVFSETALSIIVL